MRSAVTKENDEWSRMLRRDREAVGQWEKWIAVAHPADVGSALAGDDRLYSPFPVSRAAIQGLGSAIDHLGLFHAALAKTQSSRPFGYFTLARAAMFAAARTIWILSPAPRPERQRRALWLAHEDHRQYRNFTENMPASLLADPELPTRALTEMNEQFRLMEDAAARVGLTLNSKGRPRDGAIVDAAATWLDCQSTAGEKAGHYIRMLWRLHSGHAHGLSWSMQGKQEVVTRNPDGSGAMKVTASLDELAVASIAATITTNQALILYEQRASRP